MFFTLVKSFFSSMSILYKFLIETCIIALLPIIFITPIFQGLRGGIEFVLSLRFPIDVGVIVTSTLMIVLLSICLLGAGTMPALRLLKVDTAQTAESLIALSKNRSIESTKVHRKLGFVIRLQNRWVELDKRYPSIRTLSSYAHSISVSFTGHYRFLFHWLRCVHPRPNLSMVQISHFVSNIVPYDVLSILLFSPFNALPLPSLDNASMRFGI